MQHWNPTSLQHVELRGVGLTMFHVGTLVNLVSLDLSENEITTIHKCGLERLDRLRGLNLSANRLERDSIAVLPCVPAPSLSVPFFLSGGTVLTDVDDIQPHPEPSCALSDREPAPPAQLPPHCHLRNANAQGACSVSFLLLLFVPCVSDDVLLPQGTNRAPGLLDLGTSQLQAVSRSVLTVR
jgi:hypothetical protein